MPILPGWAILTTEGWRWADHLPIRSGPKGSSRNEIRFGSPIQPSTYYIERHNLSTSLFGDLPGVEPPAAAPLSQPATSGAAYRVLARKYRPQNFAQLIGQEALVRTLTNAFKAGRIAHAFMLTGVRGIGKTTTARIIAKGLNCIGADGTGGPTVEPCGVCENCTAIAADRHVDVVEMDAASHNSVDDIRELTDGARYAPALGRYKVYIIDEVHMLSKPAFNALLKTLEEPPPHVKFVLATTEIRKVPVTILSRCQRFDLRRVDGDILQAHFARILGRENESADDEALMLIARAADGSVRDGLSLLDQAIARADEKTISAGLVRDMLGLADRTVVFDLAEALLNGQAAPALTILEDLHKAGADPATVLQDLLTLVHGVTRLKLAPASSEDLTAPEAERVRGRALSIGLTMPILTRAWNILLKGLGEVNGRAAAKTGAGDGGAAPCLHLRSTKPERVDETDARRGQSLCHPCHRRAGVPEALGTVAVRRRPSPRKRCRKLRRRCIRMPGASRAGYLPRHGRSVYDGARAGAGRPSF